MKELIFQMSRYGWIQHKFTDKQCFVFIGISKCGNESTKIYKFIRIVTLNSTETEKKVKKNFHYTSKTTVR